MKYLLLLLTIICIIVPASASITIHQGENVYLNDTLDISGVTGVGIYQLAYYGTYSDIPTYVVNINNSRAFYVDPTIFKTMPGGWYKWEGNGTSTHGNNLVFNILPKERNYIDIKNISTDINASSFAPSMPPRHVADYVVARGNPLVIEVTSPAKAWIFGDTSGIYNRRSEAGKITFDTLEIDNIKSGSYILLIQYTGTNGEFNSIYNERAQSLDTLVSSRDGWNTTSESVKLITPMNLFEKVKESINKTDDTYEVFTLKTAQPFVDITSRDTSDNSYFGTITVRGYTNVANGTKMNFSVDGVLLSTAKIRPVAQTSALATKDPGDLRYFIVNIPFSYADLSTGQHSLTGTTAIGGSMTVEFHVYDLPAGSGPINTTTKYMNGSEWLTPAPTPTPEVITVIETQIVEKEVIKEKIVTITPDTGMIYSNQKKANDKTIFEVISGVAALLIGGYIISVIFRGMKNE